MPPRRIPVPPAERDYLRTLSGDALRARVQALHAGGWALSAIGEALDPPRPRSTMHSWLSPSSSSASSSIAAADFSASRPVPSLEDAAALQATAAASSASTIAAAEKSALNTPSPTTSARPYTRRSGALTSAEVTAIRSLAPVARRYRANSNPHGSIAAANDELTRICRDAHRRGVSIPELADAAGVTYKAIERRVKEKK